MGEIERKRERGGGESERERERGGRGGERDLQTDRGAET